MLKNCQFSHKETTLKIPGPAGQLEALIVGPEHSTPVTAIAVVCHPHPLYGGTMKNKVVTTIANSFKKLGAGVVRFNFRGIGESAGSYDNAVGEVDDLLAVINYLRNYCPTQPLWLAGFSFGSFIAAKVAQQQTVEKLLLIAPPVNHFDFANLPEFTAETIVVQGDQDEVVPAEEVYAWIKSRKNPPQLIRFPTATHFFHGHLGKLAEALSSI